MNNSTKTSNNRLVTTSASNNKRTNTLTTTITNNPASLFTVEQAKSNPVGTFIIGIVLFALLYLLGNYLYNYYVTTKKAKVNKKMILSAPNNGQNEYDVGGSDMPNSNYSNEYAISFWMYVDDYSYRQGLPKFVMRRGNLKTGVNPEIYLQPSLNTLQVNVSMMGNSQVGEQMMGPERATTPTPTTTTTSTPTTTAATPTTTAATTPTPTPTATRSNFTNTNVKEGFTTCDCDQVTQPDKILMKLGENDPKVPNVYNSSYFDLISGNETPAGNILAGTTEGIYAKVNPTIKHNNELNLVMEQFADPPVEGCDCADTTSSTASDSERAEFEAKAGKCMATEFPLQKWTHVVVSQYNQAIDIYVDGKLKSSCVLPGFPDVVQDDLVISPNDGFSGKITKVAYLNTALGADDVYSLYKEGPDNSETLLDRIPNWVWGVLVLLVLAVLIYTVG